MNNIAKVRGIPLLSGDGPLRKVAEKENVRVMGTIAILDELYRSNTIDIEQYRVCLIEFKNNNGNHIRFPEKEIQK